MLGTYETIDKQKNIPAFVQNWLNPFFNRLFDTEEGKLLYDVYTAREFEVDECVDGIQQSLRDITVKYGDDIIDYLHRHPNGFRNESDDPMRTFIDGYAAHGTMRHWLKYKQIYKFHIDLINSLLATEITKFSYDYLENLPYPDLYLDVSELGIGVDGAFIHINDNHVLKDANSRTVDVVTINQERSGVIGTTYIEIPNEEINIRSVFDDKYFKNFNVTTKNLMRLFINCLVYLNIEGHDVVESKVQKSTISFRNKKGKKCKSTVEAQSWEVGYRTINYKQKTTIEQEGNDNESENKVSPNTKRNSPRPHVRCGHWHKHYVGPRCNQKPVIRWHMPTFVNCAEGVKLPTVAHIAY